MKKKNIIISVSVLILSLILVLGLTYAYYRTRVVGNSENEPSISIDTKLMEIVYEDGTSEMNMTGKIEPGFTASKTFYVKNTGNETVNYSIVLDDMVNTFGRNQDWEWILTENEEEIASGILAVGTHQILVGSRNIDEIKNTYVLTLNYINSKENQSVDMGETLSFKVNIKEERYTWDNAPEGTLLYALESNQPNEDNAMIITSEDDYGMSYVYKGTVNNNYVNYSGMCWRVVRVQGDGTIKLVLADENGECDANTYSVNNASTAFINDGETYVYRDEYNVLFEGSFTSEKLNQWYNSINLDLFSLVEAEWCNDVSVAYDYGAECFEFYGYETVCYKYGAFDRLAVAPSLKCNHKGIKINGEDTKSLRYKNYIGILSADEVKITNNYSYLTTNASANDYWTMTPVYNENTDENIYIVNGYSSSLDWHYPIMSYAIRPAIVLQNNVLATYDSNSSYAAGTYQNPYKVS